jgi:hypothetical protein
MTAEIAILNRTAVTLAADSAVTLTVRGRQKIYQTADKIFDLSLLNPVALMAYNNLEYHDIPFEVIIKQFRQSDFCRDCDTLFECADLFLEYLTRQVPIPHELASTHVRRLVADEYSNLKHDFQLALNEHLVTHKMGTHVNARPIFLNVLNNRIKQLESQKASSCFVDVDHNFLLNAHGDVLDSNIDTSFSSYIATDEKVRSLLRYLSALVLHRDVFSDRMTGLVFAGFGRSELFPSLQSVEIDGVIGGRLKQRLIHKIDIDRRPSNDGDCDKTKVKIIPFAQIDMAQRFLEGIDPRLEQQIFHSVEQGCRETLDKFKKNPVGMSKRTASKAANVLERYLREALNHFKEDTLPSHRSQLRREIEDMALMMPKQELAFLAEAIINLTSIKRKVSGEEETVAGPIDVAIISRSEGLVWVRRKHYFDAELNPRYFERIKGAIVRRHRGNGHEEAKYESSRGPGDDARAGDAL